MRRHKVRKSSTLEELQQVHLQEDYLNKHIHTLLVQLLKEWKYGQMLEGKSAFLLEFFVMMISKFKDAKDIAKSINLVYYFIHLLIDEYLGQESAQIEEEEKSSRHTIEQLKSVLLQNELHHPHLQRKALSTQLYGKCCSSKEAYQHIQVLLKEDGPKAKWSISKKKDQPKEKPHIILESILCVARHHLSSEHVYELLEFIVTSVFSTHATISRLAAATLSKHFPNLPQEIAVALYQQLQQNKSDSYTLEDNFATVYLLQAGGSISRMSAEAQEKDDGVDLLNLQISEASEIQDPTAPTIDPAIRQKFSHMLETTLLSKFSSQQLPIYFGVVRELMHPQLISSFGVKSSVTSIAEQLSRPLEELNPPLIHGICRLLQDVAIAYYSSWHHLGVAEELKQSYGVPPTQFYHLMANIKGFLRHGSPFIVLQAFITLCWTAFPEDDQTWEWLFPALLESNLPVLLRKELLGALYAKVSANKENHTMVFRVLKLAWIWFHQRPSAAYIRVLVNIWAIALRYFPQDSDIIYSNILAVLDFQSPNELDDTDRSTLRTLHYSTYCFLGTECGKTIVIQSSMLLNSPELQPEKLQPLQILQKLIQGAMYDECAIRRVCARTLRALQVQDNPVLSSFVENLVGSLKKVGDVQDTDKLGMRDILL